MQNTRCEGILKILASTIALQFGLLKGNPQFSENAAFG